MRHRVVIQQRRRPWLAAVALTLAFALIAVASYAAYRFWTHPERQLFRDPDSELEKLREERRRLGRDLRAARTELAELRGKTTFDARSCEIDVQACEATKRSLAGLEAEIADLREQLAFYRNIVSPDQVRAGVRVQSLAFHAGATAGTWRYDLVLVQPMRRDRTALGRYDLKIEGLVGKTRKILPMEELRVGKPPPPVFSFRSFQELSGELKLPPAFLPSRVTVTLKVLDADSASSEVSESFDWSRLTATGKE